MLPDLLDRAHRPWAMPERRWTWRQSWCDLLFAHWPIDPAVVRAFVPPVLDLDLFEGTTWVSVVPFRMTGVMRRPWPDLPWVSAFPELNVRVYVTHGDKPGVWFLSLDATNPLAVWTARRFFHLPYHRARISIVEGGGWIRYVSRRGDARFDARYRPTSGISRARKGTLEHWLTERYCLYAQAPDGSVWRTEVHHAPWPLQAAVAAIAENTMLASHGLPIETPPACVQFSRRIDVVMWRRDRVA
jgi:uncharacterized protein YqjF (DUF2071 family)